MFRAVIHEAVVCGFGFPVAVDLVCGEVWSSFGYLPLIVGESGGEGWDVVRCLRVWDLRSVKVCSFCWGTLILSAVFACSGGLRGL